MKSCAGPPRFRRRSPRTPANATPRASSFPKAWRPSSMPARGGANVLGFGSACGVHAERASGRISERQCRRAARQYRLRQFRRTVCPRASRLELAIYLAGLKRPETATRLDLELWIPGPRDDSINGTGCIAAGVASLISAMIQPSSAACSSSPGFGHLSLMRFIVLSSRRYFRAFPAGNSRTVPIEPVRRPAPPGLPRWFASHRRIAGKSNCRRRIGPQIRPRQSLPDRRLTRLVSD